MIDLFCQINDNLWVSDGILSKKDCSLLRREALPKLSKSDVLNHSKDGVGEYKYYRTSKGAVLPKSDYSTQHEVYDVISKIEKLIESLTCLPPENQEYLQVLQYSEGQEYKKHHDFFHKDSYYYEETMARGGQRLYSFLFYLNSVEKGGDTVFPLWDFTSSPVEGRVIFWKNYESDPILDSIHVAEPVTMGEKWVGVKWVRESSYE